MGVHELMDALRIRTFLRDLFGSRLTAHMEEELLRTRLDFEARIMDRERIISDLRAEINQLNGKIDRYELVLLPLTSPAGKFFTPKRETVHFQTKVEDSPKTWAEIQADFYAKQELEDNGAHDNGR